MLTHVATPLSGVLHLEKDCVLNVNRQDRGNGSLYISEKKLIWENKDHCGLALDYKDIAIHAISRDLQAFPEECLYVMYNGKIDNGEGTNGNSHDDEESEDNDFGVQYTSSVTEIRFVPQCNENLTPMFNAMNDCQCLHPDSEDSDDFFDGEQGDGDFDREAVEYNPTYEDGGNGGFYTTEDGFHHLSSQGQATLQRLESMLAQSEITGRDRTEQMTGVKVGDDDVCYVQSEFSLGRGDEEVGDGPQQKPVDGQFDDAE